MGADKPDNETFFVLVDPSAMNVPNGVTGANKAGYHYQNVNPSRDFKDVTVTTIRNMVEGDKCPHCGAPVEIVRGIEVGQVFELGTKYSEASMRPSSTRTARRNRTSWLLRHRRHPYHCGSYRTVPR